MSFSVVDLDREYVAELERRFWPRVTKTPSGCWLWDRPGTPKGYGYVGIHHRPRYVHRVAYELANGRIPDGLTIDHLCRVRLCVNPDHLEPVTRGENVLRGNSIAAIAVRTGKCSKGHPYDERTWTTKTGKRHCRICTNRRARERARAQRREQAA